MDEISIAAARGNFLTWCVQGNMPLDALCRPLYIAQKLASAPAVVGEFGVYYSVNGEDGAPGNGVWYLPSSALPSP